MTNSLEDVIARAIYLTEAYTGSPVDWTQDNEWDEVDEGICIKLARAALAAIEASGTHAVVPVEPTEAMLDAAWAEALGEDAAGVWREMLLAARPQRDRGDG